MPDTTEPDTTETEETEHSPPWWGLGDVLAGYLVGMFLSSLIASAWVALRPGPAGAPRKVSIGGQGLAALGLWAGLAGAAVVAARFKGSGRVTRDFGFAARLPDVFVGALVGAAGHVVVLPVVALLLRPLVGTPEVSGPVHDLIDASHGVGLVGLFVFVAVGAPVVEELFFRGLLLRSLQRRLGTVWAVVISGALFGLAHPQALPAGALFLVMTSLAALGAVFAVLALRTGRLGASIVAHAVFNAWTLTLLLRR